jgi:ketosteroid isomerase-like protein
MTSEKIQIVAALYQAHANRDVPTILEFSDPALEIVQTELLPWGGHYKGFEGLQSFVGKLVEYVEAVPEPLDYIEAGDNVAVYGRLKGRLKKNGREFDIKIIHIWTLHDGKVIRFEVYIDTPAMLEALGRDKVD